MANTERIAVIKSVRRAKKSVRAAARKRSLSDADPSAVFTHVMSAERGQKPKELEVYDRAKRRTIDREITDQAIDFIKRKASAKQPFFAYLPYTQTHEPVDPHPDYNG